MVVGARGAYCQADGSEPSNWIVSGITRKGEREGERERERERRGREGGREGGRGTSATM